jgi:hypothetical protein
MSPELTPGALPAAVADALAPLPPGYDILFTRLLEVVHPDPRIRALWLGGSLARRAADRGSDLDVLVAVSDAGFEDFCASWRSWLARITPTIIARELVGLPGSFFSVTTGCERLDVVVEPAEAVGRSPYRHRLVVFDRDGLNALVPPPDDDARGPDAARLSAIVEEFFRQQAIFPAAVVAREDWLLGVVGVMATQHLLYQVFVETNQPLPPMGVKQWSSRLSAEQRAVLESLPVPAPTREATIRAMLAVRAAMLTHGRSAVENLGCRWPDTVDAAVAAYYARELGTSSTGPEPDASALSTSATTRMDKPAE